MKTNQTSWNLGPKCEWVLHDRYGMHFPIRYLWYWMRVHMMCIFVSMLPNPDVTAVPCQRQHSWHPTKRDYIDTRTTRLYSRSADCLMTQQQVLFWKSLFRPYQCVFTDYPISTGAVQPLPHGVYQGYSRLALKAPACVNLEGKLGLPTGFARFLTTIMQCIIVTELWDILNFIIQRRTKIWSPVLMLVPI